MASAKADTHLTQADVYSGRHNLNAKEIEMMTELFSKETVLLIERMKAGRLLSDADRCRVRLELWAKLKEINETLWQRTSQENRKIQAVTGEVVALLETDHFESLEAQK